MSDVSPDDARSINTNLTARCRGCHRLEHGRWPPVIQ
jgi:hypothetical protein